MSDRARLLMRLRPSSHGADGRGRRALSRAGAEAGVTIVELLVASLILGLGVMAVSALFVASDRSGAAAQIQIDATDLASAEIEIIRSLPYDQVGIATGAPGYEPEVDGRPTVTEAGTNSVVGKEEVKRGDNVFVVQRSVTWMKTEVSGSAYKLVVIRVWWETSSGSRNVELQTGVYERSEP